MRINKMIGNFVLHLLILLVIVTGSKYYDTIDAEIDQILKKLNKPAIKSIQSPDGDIIDCIHMKNHPIYDHPLLKNHTIQTFDLLRVRGKFHGVKAFINVWKPYIQTPREFSLALMTLRAGTNSELNTIDVGWQVNQNHYIDDNPRYYIFWTVDGYRSTCINLECPGFMQVNREFVLGAAVGNISTLNGQQYDIPMEIWKDPQSGNWWLRVFEHITVGYWPSILFNHLQEGATEIHWGGEIGNLRYDLQHTTTKMGSGRFAEEGYKKASYFRNIEILDEHDIVKQPVGGFTYITKESCYNIIPSNSQNWGVHFFYGGPGRNPNCII